MCRGKCRRIYLPTVFLSTPMIRPIAEMETLSFSSFSISLWLAASLALIDSLPFGLPNIFPFCLAFFKASLVLMEMKVRSISEANDKVVAIILEFRELSKIIFCLAIWTTGFLSAEICNTCKHCSVLLAILDTSAKSRTSPFFAARTRPVSYTHLRAHETDSYLVCRLLLEKKKKKHTN